MSFKPIVCLDFDGVIHSYTSGWMGVSCAPDPPVAGIKQFILDLLFAGYRVCVYSSRSKSLFGRRAMKSYINSVLGNALSPNSMGLDLAKEDIEYPWFKPSALVTIDDRAICFTGVFPSITEIKYFKPWNKK